MAVDGGSSGRWQQWTSGSSRRVAAVDEWQQWTSGKEDASAAVVAALENGWFEKLARVSSAEVRNTRRAGAEVPDSRHQNQ
ncbi:Protein of unknown function [Pyronema omphalodes CBS 100304]|uniref:Uncharacterized protein n=1 Tax=Pyronema omphalodes (strain CBS 100304) TaxID=1076935 RepID=U4LTZ3_PYROM|nr:Protein of unknown function [Pyronema omphalodes CBS 100304]